MCTLTTARMTYNQSSSVDQKRLKDKAYELVCRFIVEYIKSKPFCAQSSEHNYWWP